MRRRASRRVLSVGLSASTCSNSVPSGVSEHPWNPALCVPQCAHSRVGQSSSLGVGTPYFSASHAGAYRAAPTHVWGPSVDDHYVKGGLMSVIHARASGLAPNFASDRGEEVIAVDRLSKRFGRVLAVDDLTFRLKRGTVTGFLGPNGAGKTTTLRMLLGLTRPTGGAALVFGLPYQAIPNPASSRRRRPGGNRLPSRPLGSRSPVDARVRGRPGRARRVDEVLSLVELSGAARRRVGGYSLGMRQRLGTRGRAARRPRAVDPRRAGQRPRSRRACTGCASSSGASRPRARPCSSPAMSSPRSRRPSTTS